MFIKKISVLLILVTITPILYTKSLKVAAVQLEITERTYFSVLDFKNEMESVVKEAVDTFHPDLIIFPEYTSVFLAVTPYGRWLGKGLTSEEIFAKVRENDTSLRSIRDVLVRQAPFVEEQISLWGDLSSRYGVAILGGTYFALEGGKLTNRLFIYDDKGDRVYEQDKFFLTDFEEDIAGLSPGAQEEPEGYYLNGKKIVFTICRDTFLDRWEEIYDGSNLWIDIKANGEAYGEEQEELFSRALPARLEDSAVPYGATVCMTGSFLELFWEGESSFIGKTEEGVYTFIRTATADKKDILYFQVN